MRNVIRGIIYSVASFGPLFTPVICAYSQDLRNPFDAPKGTLVVDSRGKVVGPLVGENTVLRKVNGVWLGIPVSTQRFLGNGFIEYVFSTADCSGTKYIASGGLPATSFVNKDAPPSTKIHLIYAGTPVSSIITNSGLMIINNVPQACKPLIASQLLPVGPPQIIDITDQFGLIPPFRLR